MDVTTVLAPERTKADVTNPVLAGWGSNLKEASCGEGCVLPDLRRVLTRSWDVRFIYDKDTPHEITALRLFSPKTLQTSGSCSVCRLMTRSLNGDPSNIISGLERCELDTGKTAQGKAVKLVGFRPVLHESFQSRPSSLLSRVLRWKIYGDLLVDEAQSRLFILPLGDDAHLLGNEPDNYARILQPNYASLECIRKWLRRCEHGHVACRVSREHSTIKQHPARLVDVIDGCIDQDVHWPARYFALSYVWGTIDNKDTAKYFAGDRRGARIFLSVDQLPRVIQDAIKLTRDVGERYLWVDALCINQIDLAEKAAEIAKMNHVYSGATLTIVALGSTHANTGLHGVSAYSPPRRTEVETIAGIRLTTVLPRVQEILSWPSCRWTNRAWTMQEHLLSDRMLMMGPRQAYFVCRQTMYSEDRYESETTMFPNNLQRRRATDGLGLWNDWTSHVEEYTARAITMPDDRYQAIRGYLNEIEAMWNTKFIYGLPVKHLPQALYWLQGLASNRCAPVICTRIDPYPSWCWTGWTGQVHYPSLGAFHCFVSGCTIVHSGQRRSFNVDSYGSTSEGPSKQPKCQSSNDSHLSIHSHSEHKSRWVGDSPVCDPVFASTSASLVLQAPLIILKPSIFKDGMFGIRHKEDGPYVGIIFCQDSSTNDDATPDSCTCLVLGTSWQRSKMPLRLRKTRQETFPQSYLDWFLPRSHDDGTYFRHIQGHIISVIMTYFAYKDRFTVARKRLSKQLYDRLFGDDAIDPMFARIMCIVSLALATPMLIAFYTVALVLVIIVALVLEILWGLVLVPFLVLGPFFTMLLNMRVARRPASRVDNALLTAHTWVKVAHFLWIEDVGNGQYIRRGAGEMKNWAYKQYQAEVKTVKLI